MGGALGEKLGKIADEFNERRRVQGRPGLQGHLCRDDDRRHRRVPRRQPAAHPAGAGGRHRHVHGGQGCGQAGPRGDGGSRASRSTRRPICRRDRLLHRTPTARCCRSRSTARRRCSTTTRTPSRRPASTPSKPPRTWEEVGEHAKKLRGCRHALRLHHAPGCPGSSSRTSAPGTTCRFATKANGFDGLDTELKINSPLLRQAHRHAGRVAEDKQFDYGGRTNKATPKFTSGECAHVHRDRRPATPTSRPAPRFDFGIAPLPYWPDVAGRAAEHDHRRRLACG